MTKESRVRLLLLLVLLLATWPRLSGLDWDAGIGAHPDERHIVGVAERLRASRALNPLSVDAGFAYGHLPVYLLMLAQGLAPRLDALLLGRAVAASFGLGTVALTVLLARRLYGDGVALLAGAFVALAVQPVQQTHFYTADGPLTFFCVACLVGAARLASCGRRRDALGAGVCLGLALSTKFSALLLLLPLGLACLEGAVDRQRRAHLMLLAGGAALLTFAIANPFAVIDFPAFARNVAAQAAMARGSWDLPYTRQFHGTRPYLYPLIQQLRWGLGWLLGGSALAGFGYAFWRALRREASAGTWVALVWVLPGLAFWGRLYVKFPRYLLPLVPLLLVFAGRLLLNVARRWCRWGVLLIAVVLLAAGLRCGAFVQLYRRPHPWVAASEWIYAHVPRGAVIAVEAWDHPLPVDASGYDVRTLPVFAEDTPEKWQEMDATLAAADYVVLASRRGYATLARWPERYPRTAAFYRALFEGEAGWMSAACFSRYPRIGPWAFVDDPTRGLPFSLPTLCLPENRTPIFIGRLDESFVVYDHPRVLIFQRVDAP